MNTYRLYCDEMGIKPYISIRAADPLDAIGKYVDKYIRVYDADICGSRTHYFAVVDDDQTLYYRVEYSWYLDYDPDWQLIDSVEIEQVTKQQTSGLIGDRDWIRV